MDINTIAVLGLILAVIVSLFLILSLRSLTKLLQESTNSITILTKDVSKNLTTLTNDFTELKVKISETLDGVNIATKQLTNTAQNLDNEVQKANDIINTVSSLVNLVSHKIYPPLNYAATLVSASTKAVSTFVEFFSRK
jgi:hypothetical protein